MSIKIIKKYKNYNKGDKIEVDAKLGIKLISNGIAIAHKQMIYTKEK